MMTWLGSVVVFIVVAWFVLGGLQWGRRGFGGGMILPNFALSVLRLIPPIVWAMAVAFAAGAVVVAATHH